MAEWYDITDKTYWRYSPWLYPAEFDGTKWLWLIAYQTRTFFVSPKDGLAGVHSFRVTFSPGSADAAVEVYEGTIGSWELNPAYPTVYAYNTSSPTELPLTDAPNTFWGFNLDQRYNSGEITKIEVYADEEPVPCIYRDLDDRFLEWELYAPDVEGEWTRSFPSDTNDYFQAGDWQASPDVTLTYAGLENLSGKILTVDVTSGGASGTATINGVSITASGAYVVPWSGTILMETTDTKYVVLNKLYFCGEGAPPPPNCWWTTKIRTVELTDS